MRYNEKEIGQKWANLYCHCGNKIVNHDCSALIITCQECKHDCFSRGTITESWIANLKPCRDHEWSYNTSDLEPAVDHFNSYQDGVSEATVSINVYCINEECEATGRLNIYSNNPTVDDIQNEANDY
jgi:hypothetical protein